MVALPSHGSDDKAAARRGAILGIDYGRRRIGLALSDELGLTAQPLQTWTRINRARDIARLRALCREHGVCQIVVGWPLRLDGTPGEMAAEAGRFAERVRKHLGMPVELVDERLSSWQARQTMAENQSRRESARGNRALDEVAAAVILRDYLSRASKTQSE